jgi:hypothetical protein
MGLNHAVFNGTIPSTSHLPTTDSREGSENKQHIYFSIPFQKERKW